MLCLESFHVFKYLDNMNSIAFTLFFIYTYLSYGQFHKTLPKSSLQVHWISVRFYEMSDMTPSFGTGIETEDKMLCKKNVLKGQCRYFNQGFNLRPGPS